MLESKKIGLMGCGCVADYGHIPAILATPGLVLHAVFDPDASKLAQIREKYGIPNTYTDSEEFFRSGIEAVSITSPASCHKQNVFDCARFGMPVICEKPLAMNRTESEEMVAAMKKADLSLYSGFCYRFSPCALKIRELIQKKAIGNAGALRLIYNWNCHGKYDIGGGGEKVIQKRRENRMLEGGPLVDCGTHQIDLAMFWLNSDIVACCGHGAWADDYEAPDHMWLHMDHSNGAHTVVEVSFSYHHTSKDRRLEFVYEIIGSEGVIRYDRENKSFTLKNSDGTCELDFYPEKDFESMYAEWAQSLHTGESALLTTAEAGMRVIDIARKATDDAIRKRIRHSLN